MIDSPVSLVVGADGAIGAALLRAIRPAVGTSRRAGAHGLPLDLAAPPAVWVGPPVSVAYLCGAVARLDACERDSAGTARVNVAGIVAVARLLAARGAFVVFFSTNHVFDGTKPLRRPDEPTCPRNEYGRQKAAAEREILALGGAVLRLTKVLAGPVPLFARWVDQARRAEAIGPFSDMVMAPVPLDTTVAFARAIGESRLPGVHHLSADRDISYAAAATIGLRLAGLDPDLIHPVAAGPGPDRPPHTTLDTLGLPARLGVVVPPVEETVRAAFRASTPGRAAA